MPRIVLGDNLDVLRDMDDGTAQLVYVDPPFNTGKRQVMDRVASVRADTGSIGFDGNRYSSAVVSSIAYDDMHDDYLGFLEERLLELHRVLSDDGSLFFHIDPRESHYCKVLLDGIFGRSAFMNEIIWAYDYGGRSKSRWSSKHDVILWYARDPRRYTYDFGAIDRIPYMAPSLVTPEKAARGKTPTDVWWNTIVPTNGKERTGYPTQKPLAILERIVKVHSNPGDVVLDCFAGSGTAGEAAARHGRDFVLVDSSPEAIDVMEDRLRPYSPVIERAATDGTRNHVVA